MRRITAANVKFFALWAALAFVASTANFLSRKSQSIDSSWFELLIYHFGYWNLWGGYYLVIERWSPRPSRMFSSPVSSGLGWAAIIFGAIFLFSAYYVLISLEEVDWATAPGSILSLLFGNAHTLSYHGMTTFIAIVLIVISGQVSQEREAKNAETLRQTIERENQKLAEALSEARLSALRGQIHPHFIFNALNGIASLIEAQRNDRAYEAVNSLSALLRLTFRLVDRSVVTLQEEVALARATLEIGALRFEDRLKWSINLPETLRDEFVPPFLIQPLVENSLRHAVGATLRPIEIAVAAADKDGALELRVEDNGPGAPDEATHDKAGIGLSNLRRRLELTYGGDASCAISTPQGGGFRITLRIPKIRQPKEHGPNG